MSNVWIHHKVGHFHILRSFQTKPVLHFLTSPSITKLNTTNPPPPLLPLLLYIYPPISPKHPFDLQHNPLSICQSLFGLFSWTRHNSFRIHTYTKRFEYHRVRAESKVFGEDCHSYCFNKEIHILFRSRSSILMANWKWNVNTKGIRNLISYEAFNSCIIYL